MRLIVADSYGSGHLYDHDGVAHELAMDAWTETDLRDHIVAGDQGAGVRYRKDERIVHVGAGQPYQIEAPESEDVIDVRTATDAAHQLVRATTGSDTDTPAIFHALEMAPHDHSHGPWVEQLVYLYHHECGWDLHERLRDILTTDEYDRAERLLA